MKIISKFKDYYDGVQRYGRDESILYIRKQELLKKNDGAPLIHSVPHDYRFGFSAHGFVVLFCGKKYPGVRLEFSPHWSDVERHGMKDQIVHSYNIEDCFKFMEANRAISSGIDKKMELFFANNIGEDQKTLIDFGCPVMVIGRPGFYTYGLTWPEIHRLGSEHMVIKNPNLKSLEFFRVVDTTQAFQSIQNFLSGVLGNSVPPVVVVSEKTRIKKRGFDEWSFRKLPTKKK